VITDQPRPLPECRLCQQPTKRRTWRANDGLCTDCRRAYDASRGHQTALLLPLDPPADPQPDLTNVVLLRPRHPR
jgi:hypothetical protein